MLLRFVFQWFCVVLLSCCFSMRATCQLTARDADGKVATEYAYPDRSRDTIFVFNQDKQPQRGNLSLVYRPPSSIEWAFKNQDEPFAKYPNFTESTESLDAGEYQITVTNLCTESITIIECKVDIEDNEDGTYTVTVSSDNFEDIQEKSEPKGQFTVKNDPIEAIFNWYKLNESKEFSQFQTQQTIHSSADDLYEGGYMVTVMLPEMVMPCDTFVAWIYRNPGFDFELRKNDNNEVLGNQNNCDMAEFFFRYETVPSTFEHYYPRDLKGATYTLINSIRYAMERGNEIELDNRLVERNWDEIQYIRHYFFSNPPPPYEDTQYRFRAYDRFGIEKRDELMYRTVLPYAEITHELPEKDETSAKVPVIFSRTPFEISEKNIEYVWRFGNGDSIVFDRNPTTESFVYEYTTPRTQPYQVTLKITSAANCEYIATLSEPITVSPPSLDVGNVFTPNGDGWNDTFKPNIVSLRHFEITIYTRTGKRIFFYQSGEELREWDGWDGRIQNTNNDAPSGVYFYNIRALGWDNPPTENPHSGPYRGSFYLFREDKK